MLRVYRSESDAFVLIHEATQTVMLGESLDEAYQRLEAKLGDKFSALPPAAVEGTEGKVHRAVSRFGFLAVLALLPFVWLAVLHTSVGSLIVELRGSTKSVAGANNDMAEPPSKPSEFDALGARVERLANDVRSLKHDGEQPKAKGKRDADVRAAAAVAVKDADDGSGSDGDSGAGEDAGTGDE